MCQGRQSLDGGVGPHVTRPMEHLADRLTYTVRGLIVAGHGRDVSERRIGGGSFIAWERVPSDGYLCRSSSPEVVVPDLDFAANQVAYEQAVGDEPLTGTIAAGIGDLHAALIEVVDLAGPAWRLGIG